MRGGTPSSARDGEASSFDHETPGHKPGTKRASRSKGGFMADKTDTNHTTPLPDRGDATPPHGDELRSEESFGRTNRDANADDPDAERPVLSDETLDSAGLDREQRFDRIDDEAERSARMEVRRRERRSG
jgi:hypothetical protein